MMGHHQLELVQRLEAAGSLDDVWSIADAHLAAMGFERSIYTLIDATAQRPPLVWTSMPPSWRNHYAESGFDRIDPYYRYCCRGFAPIGTGISYLPDHPFLTVPEQRLIREGSEAGLRSGFSAPVGLLGSREIGGWNFGSGLSRARFERLAAARGSDVRLAGWYIHQRALALWRPDRTDNRGARLSPRERECLLWLSRGLRTAAIADRLGLAEVTVELHLRRAR